MPKQTTLHDSESMEPNDSMLSHSKLFNTSSLTPLVFPVHTDSDSKKNPVSTDPFPHFDNYPMFPLKIADGYKLDGLTAMNTPKWHVVPPVETNRKLRTDQIEQNSVSLSTMPSQLVSATHTSSLDALRSHPEHRSVLPLCTQAEIDVDYVFHPVPIDHPDADLNCQAPYLHEVCGTGSLSAVRFLPTLSDKFKVLFDPVFQSIQPPALKRAMDTDDQLSDTDRSDEDNPFDIVIPTRELARNFCAVIDKPGEETKVSKKDNKGVVQPISVNPPPLSQLNQTLKEKADCLVDHIIESQMETSSQVLTGRILELNNHLKENHQIRSLSISSL